MSETDYPTPITDADERNYPQPEYLQLIQFEGCTMGVIDPDGYGELYEKCRNLERRLAAVSEQRDKLTEALDGLIPTDARPMECDSPQLKAARAALSAVKGGKP